MKLVMDKRTHEFDRREKRWKQELISAKSPHNNSRVSLNSSSDESGEIVNNSSLTNDQTNPKGIYERANQLVSHWEGGTGKELIDSLPKS